MGIEMGASRYKEFLDPFSSAWGRNQQGQASYNTSLNYKWINEEILTYTKKIGDHSFSALAGFVASRYVGESANSSIRGFSDNKIHSMNAGTVLNKPSEDYGASTNASVLGRVTYDYQNKYLATVNFRADGSSKFGVNNRWGYFPSFSLGWRLTGEEFMKPLDWLSDLKLRVGWGQVGNDQVGYYSSYGIYGIGANYNMDGVILPGYYQSQIGNDKLRWERTTQTNVGLDFSFLNGRMTLTADAYYKKTTDLLLMVKLPQTSGFDSGMQNVGSVVNKGLEFQLTTRNLTGELKWTTDFNISTNKNEVTDMAGSPAIFTGSLDKKISGNVSIIQKGQALGSFYGFQAAGVNPQNGRMMYEKANGMLVYEEDLSADEDRRILGCAQPKFLYGINNVFSYKNFDLSFFFQGSYGNDIYNAYPIYDWKTTDVWTANGKFQWDYNVLYDLYYRAGVNLERQRVASPFINEAQESLQLYRVLDPNTWGKMVGRVNGVNFTGMYGGTHAMGWQSVKLPEGYTWREFMYFLLSTLPERARKNYLRKLSVSVNFWRTKGGCLSDATIQKLIDAKVPIIVMDNSNYKTLKKPVRMEYQDDIDIPEFKEIPTYKRMCVCILKNDHACKYMGFSPTKEEMSKRSQIMEQYRIIVS